MPMGNAAFNVDATPLEAGVPEFAEPAVWGLKQQPRAHVIRAMARSGSGRLACDDELAIEIPDLMIYAAR